MKQVAPRITLVAALDSSGSLHASLLQANSDSDTMQLFFTEYIKTLDAEDRNWRSNSLIMLDNASYHDSKEVLELLE